MKNFDIKEFGEKLRYLRKEAGIGQNQLAELLKISNASVSYWETGKQQPSAEAIFKIAIFFNVSADFLLGIDD
ncbi:MAG: helix-turn-helix transcriptional regulator [Clostridiales bacterium]|nr:helix-turn-helix transcriptional regulator [Clostridiales bacterium]MBQ3047337.1 helix-turn-helix transcriptional regulator [Clostridia bacterium]